MAPGHPEAVTERLKGCQDAKDAAQGRISLIGKERDKLNKSFSPLKDLFTEPLAAKGPSDAVTVTLGVEHDSLKESLSTREAELEGLLEPVCAKSYLVELLKSQLEQQETSSGKT